MRDLPSLVQGGKATFASAINNAGQVVGYSSANDNTSGTIYSRAVLWENGASRNLGVLAIGSPDDDYSHARADNNRGRTVGASSDHAFVYENGTMADLHSYALGAYPVATKSEGASINNNGQILVSVAEGGSNVFNRHIVLTPR